MKRTILNGEIKTVLSRSEIGKLKRACDVAMDAQLLGDPAGVKLRHAILDLCGDSFDQAATPETTATAVTDPEPGNGENEADADDAA